MSIILASSSPRRKELMKLIFSEFVIRPSDITEIVPQDIDCEHTAEYLASKKANSIIRNPDDLVIGCDTVVAAENRILGKPSSHEECREMLRQLSGKTHSVYTGVSIIVNDAEVSFTEKTYVTFWEISDDEIEKYIITGEPFDKAGGYGIQGKGALFVKSIKGDYFNVVGLPVSRLNFELKKIMKSCKE